MKRKLSSAASVAAIAVLSGCAGISGEDGALIACLFAPSIVGCDGPGDNQAHGSPPPPPVPFTRWSNRPADSGGVIATGTETVVGYDIAGSGPSPDSITPAAGDGFRDSVATALTYNSEGLLLNWTSSHAMLFGGIENMTMTGQPGIDYLWLGGRLRSDFSNPLFAQAVGLVANPYKLGWEYQSFGVWNALNEVSGARSFGGTSYGSATPIPTMPSGGRNSFVGKLAGMYVSPDGVGSMVTADANVNVDFGTRSLSFESRGTTTTRIRGYPTSAPVLDLRGTLSYAPNSNAFTGTLTNTGGTMSGASHGKFYGPAASELGGVFTLRSSTSVETFSGAYGAKR